MQFIKSKTGIAVIILITTFVFLYLFSGAFGGTKIGVTLKTNPTLEDGLVGHWTFDGLSFDSASNTAEILDESGSQNNGDWKEHATTTLPGAIGQAIEFDGVDDYISMHQEADQWEGLDTLSASVWVYPHSVSRAGILIANVNNNQNIARLGFTANSNIRADVHSDSAQTVAETGVGVINLNAWNHIAFSHNGTTTLYVNGSEVAESTITSTTTRSGSNGNLILGDTSSFFFDGLMDDVRIYNKALTEEDVTRLYGMGLSNVSTGDIAGYNLENGLIKHYTFDTEDVYTSSSTGEIVESVGSTTADWIEHGTTTASGYVNESIDFDGTDDQIVDSATSSFDGLTSATFALWVKSDVSGQDRGIIESDTAVGNDHIMSMRYDGTGVTGGGSSVIKLAFGTIANVAYLESSEFAQTTDWQHLVATWSAGGAPSLYINGALDTPTASASGGATVINEVEEFRIGVGYGYNYWNGLIDDVRVYNRALSSGEAYELYRLGASTTPSRYNSTTTINKTLNTNSELQNGLVGHWSFDGPDVDLAAPSAEILDKSGNGNDGDWLNHATSTVPGKIGQGIEFDGVDDTVLIDSPDMIENKPELTVSFWAKSDKGTFKEETFTRARVDNNNTVFEMAAAANSNISWRVYNTLNENSSYQIADLTEGRWYHFVGVYDGAAHLWIDGEYQGSGSTIGGNTDTGGVGESLNIGSGNGAATLQGSIDDYRLYNRALSTSSIQRLYQLGQ